MPNLFPFEHNWSSPFKVDLSYKTEIIQSRSFREQRLALRTQPRKRLSLSVSASGLELRSFLSQMAARQQAEWVVPEVTRASLTATASLSGSSTVNFGSTTPPWAVAGAYCVLQTISGKLLRSIVSVTVGVVTLNIPLTADLPVGAKVYPGLVGRLENSIKGTFLTNAVGTFSFVFDADPGTNRMENVTTAPTSFNGRELFLLKPNWQQNPQLTFESMLETIDYGRGRLNHSQPINWNIETIRLEYLRRNASEAETLTQFFHRMSGQQGEFYMPTWVNDFELSIGAASGATILNQPTSTMFDLYGSSPVYKAAIVFFRDGTYQSLKLNSLTLVSGNSRFTFATPFAQSLNRDSIKLMCWLPAWRLSIDTLSLGWLTRTVAQAQLTMRTIEDLV